MVRIKLPKFFAKRIIRSEADKELYGQIRRTFGIKPLNLSLYQTALIHKSACSAHHINRRVNNERLEYLGDSILDAIVAEYLFTHFSERDEGFLTKMRSRIVSRNSLNALAIAIGLDAMVTLQTNNPLAHRHIFGDALEAFVGAIYLDRGFAYAKKWVSREILNKLVNLDELQTTETDYKSRIIEWAQKRKHIILFSTEEMLEERGKSPSFECKLHVSGKVLGTGFGDSKKEAEQNAAMVALERIDILEGVKEPHVTESTVYFQN